MFIGYDREGENSLQVKRVTDSSNQALVNAIKYKGRGQLTVLDRSAVADTTYLYHPQTDAAGGGVGDSNFRLKTIQNGSAGDTWFDFTYQYDKAGNITQLLTNNGASDTQNFNYDTLNRLTGVSGSFSATYTYNRIGNLSTPAANSYNYTTWNTACTPPGQSLPHAVKQIGNSYFCYDKNGNMTVRYHGSITYNQGFDIENRLVSVNKVGTGTTSFAYDAAGQRVKAVRPNGGGTVYTPFPTYEEELRGAATITRRTYTLAGQAIAVQVDGDPTAANNGLFYFYGDHLGSATVLNKGGAKVAGSETYYAPFGAYRNTPTTNPAISDRGYTGHLENMEIGLVYMNARYYVPYINPPVQAAR